MSEDVHTRRYPPLLFGSNNETLLYEDLLAHCLISGSPETGTSSAAFLILAQHIAAGGNFLYMMNGQTKVSQIAKLLAITGLSQTRHHIHHLHVTPKQPLKPFFVQPFLSGLASVIISPASDGDNSVLTDKDYTHVITSSLNLLSLKFTRNALQFSSLPRLLAIDKADTISDRLLSDVLKRAKMSGVAVILILEDPRKKPLSVPLTHLQVLLRDSHTQPDDFWKDISGLPIAQDQLSLGQAYVFCKKGYPSTPLIRHWAPFQIPPHILA